MRSLCAPFPPSLPQNKIDLVTESAATNQQEDIQKFIQGTVADGAPVVPVSAQLKYNVDVVCEYIMRKVPVPVRCVSYLCACMCVCLCVLETMHIPQPLSVAVVLTAHIQMHTYMHAHTNT